MRRALAALPAALWLAACAGAAVWTKPGAGDADFQRDSQACAAQGAALSGETYDPRTLGLVSDQQNAQRLAASCLEARGWRLTPR